MSQKNVETLRAAYQAWNNRDFDGLLRHVADNFTLTDRANSRTTTTKQDYRTWAENWARTFSDGKIVNLKLIDGGDYVIGQFTAEGTNDGSYAGLAPTGGHISFSVCEIFKFDQSGNIVACDCYYDQYTILTQLGYVQKFAHAA
jgi:steroid delta-isomerase-like uncharacterized protein